MPHDGPLWPQDRPDPSPSAESPDSPFPERLVPAEAHTERAPLDAATVTRRTLAAGGLAGVALLAACQTVPGAVRLRQRALGQLPRPGLPTPTATPSSVPLSTVTVTPSPTTTTAPTTTSATSTSTSATTSATTTAATTTAATTTAATTTTSTTAAPPVGPVTAELLLARATYGATSATLAEAKQAGLAAWLDRQLQPAGVPDPMGDRIRAAYPDLGRTGAQLKAAAVDRYRLMRNLQGRAAALATWSSRQVYEVMVDFWANHLNVSLWNDDDRQQLTRPDYDRAVIRANALGTFLDMLRASGMHPSMMRYLNLDNSRRGAINENYAREIMELHTVGIDGGYTETDIRNLATLLTGWYVDGNTLVAGYDPNRHQAGPITVMGRTFDNPAAGSGPEMWTQVTDFLAKHPATARFLSMKLARHFVADEPPAALVDAMAKAYLDNGTAIVPVLRVLFASPEFAASGGMKVRRPYERYIAVLRLLAPAAPNGPAEIVDAGTRIVDALPAQDPMGWGPPDGYPDKAAEWTAPGTALDLLNATARAARKGPDKIGLVGIDPVLAGGGPTTRADVAVAVSRYVLLRDPSDVEIDAVVALLGSGNLPAQLAAGSGQQRRAVELAATLLLVSPAHLLP